VPPPSPLATSLPDQVLSVFSFVWKKRPPPTPTPHSAPAVLAIFYISFPTFIAVCGSSLRRLSIRPQRISAFFGTTFLLFAVSVSFYLTVKWSAHRPSAFPLSLFNRLMALLHGYFPPPSIRAAVPQCIWPYSPPWWRFRRSPPFHPLLSAD